jgi:hypothetical protein
MTDGMVAAADTDKDGSVGFSEFVAFARKRPDLFGKLQAQNIDRFLCIGV